MYECTKTFEIKPPAYSGCGSMLVHKGTLWYALESGRERTTLTDSRIKLVLSDRLCELLRLIEVGASCFNHYCAGYDDT